MARAFGPGELPGVSLDQAAEVILGETGDLPHLPQLPARGLGSDALGRTASLLPGLRVDRGPRSWQLVARPQLATRRAWDTMERDLDRLEELWGGLSAGLKIQVMGPWSVATGLELSDGHRALTDPGALRDITESLAEGIIAHRADVAARFGLAVDSVVVQLDEPYLARVLAGSVSGTSQWDRIPAVHPRDVAPRLAGVVAAVGGEVLLNLLGQEPNWEVMAGLPGVGVMVAAAGLRGRAQLDGVGQAVAEGTRVGLAVDTCAGARESAIAIARLWDELGLDRVLLVDQVDVLPIGPWPRLLDAAHAYATAREVAGILERDAGDL